MTDDSAVTIQSEDVHSSIVHTARRMLKAVKNDNVAFGNDTLYVGTLSGIITRHSLEIIDERIFSRWNAGIVLDVVSISVQV